MSHQPLFSTSNLSVFFPVYEGVFRSHINDVKALQSVSLNVYEGEILGIVGESGCGKSTLARALLALSHITHGDILYQGKSLQESLKTTKQRKQFRKEVQVVFQDPYSSLNPRKLVGDVIIEAILYHDIAPTYEQAKTMTEDLFEKVGLSAESLDRYPHEFSGGQQQRICIARALSVQPKVLFFDEAVSALDVSVQAQVLNLLLNLKKEFSLTYVFISHDLSVVEAFCDRIAVLYLGKVVEVSPCKELFEGPKHPYTQALLQAIPKRHPRQEKNVVYLEGDIPSPLNPPPGCPFHTRCPLAKKECEEAFPQAKSTEKNHIYHCIL